jgi:hypothetical protein
MRLTTVLLIGALWVAAICSATAQTSQPTTLGRAGKLDHLYTIVELESMDNRRLAQLAYDLQQRVILDEARPTEVANQAVPTQLGQAQASLQAAAAPSEQTRHIRASEYLPLIALSGLVAFLGLHHSESPITPSIPFPTRNLNRPRSPAYGISRKYQSGVRYDSASATPAPMPFSTAAPPFSVTSQSATAPAPAHTPS